VVVVLVVDVVVLLFVALQVRWRPCCMMSVALEVFSFTMGLLLACVTAVCFGCSGDDGCLGALPYAWCCVLLVALCALRHCSPRCS
jgi:hypothetical protein